MTVNSKQIPWAATATVLLGAGVMLAVAALRGAEYDEGYTLLLAAGTPRPAWPTGVFTVAEARVVFAGHASLAEIARALRTTDVHPPLYFWTVAAWRWVAGPGLFGVRLLSVLYGALALMLAGGNRPAGPHSTGRRGRADVRVLRVCVYRRDRTGFCPRAGAVTGRGLAGATGGWRVAYYSPP